MKLIDADKLSADMYHEAFAKDSDMQKWDNGCWIRYKMFEDVLKAQPAVQPNTTTHDSIPAKKGGNDEDRTSGDCISRAQAIDALKEKVFRNLTDEFYGAMQVLDELPSVQPETNCSEIPNNSDTISRQAALETIRTMQTYKLFAGDDMILVDKAQVQTELMMLPTVQPEQRWIPCSERQPDKEGDYLVTLLDDGRTWVEIALWNETFGGRWQAVLYNDVDYSDISNVIAWMPLPEPYQEEGEQDG